MRGRAGEGVCTSCNMASPPLTRAAAPIGALADLTAAGDRRASCVTILRMEAPWSPDRVGEAAARVGEAGPEEEEKVGVEEADEARLLGSAAEDLSEAQMNCSQLRWYKTEGGTYQTTCRPSRSGRVETCQGDRGRKRRGEMHACEKRGRGQLRCVMVVRPTFSSLMGGTSAPPSRGWPPSSPCISAAPTASLAACEGRDRCLCKPPTLPPPPASPLPIKFNMEP